MAQEDLLEPAGRLFRTCAAALMTIATILVGTLLLVLVIDHIARRSLYYGGKPLWVCTLVFVYLTPASAWLTVRLWTGTPTDDRPTLMPLWFIELYGLLSCVGFVAIGITTSSPSFAVSGLGVPLAMLLIRRTVRRAAERDRAI